MTTGAGRCEVPLVSVIITTRNRVSILDRALFSVYRQDYPRIELLVMDDASEDGTSEYVRMNHPAARSFRFEENRGLVAARNFLMQEASGDYLVSLDDDAYFLHEDAVSKVIERMSPEPEVAVVSFGVLERGDGEPLGGSEEYYASGFVGCGHCIRKEVLREAGAYREVLFYVGEEEDLALRLLDRGYRILYFPGARIVHEPSPIGRDPFRRVMYGTRNLLLRAWWNEPSPWWVLTTAMALARAAASIGTRQGVAMWTGIWRAMKDWQCVRPLRRPVSGRAMRVFVGLRGSQVRLRKEVEALYQAPPSLARTLLGEATRRLSNGGRS